MQHGVRLSVLARLLCTDCVVQFEICGVVSVRLTCATQTTDVVTYGSFCTASTSMPSQRRFCLPHMTCDEKHSKSFPHAQTARRNTAACGNEERKARKLVYFCLFF